MNYDLKRMNNAVGVINLSQGYAVDQYIEDNYLLDSIIFAKGLAFAINVSTRVRLDDIDVPVYSHLQAFRSKAILERLRTSQIDAELVDVAERSGMCVFDIKHIYSFIKRNYNAKSQKSFLAGLA